MPSNLAATTESEEVNDTNSAKAEWVALMCLIAERDRDLYRELRAEAWESVLRCGRRSSISN